MTMANERDIWVSLAIERIRSLDNVQDVTPLHWVGDEFLCFVTPSEPTAEPGGGWAQPTEPLYVLLGEKGWRVAEDVQAH